MIILLGPDHTGKTTLAQKLRDKYNLQYFHYSKESDYKDYVEPMCALDWWDGILDRHAICEFPYAHVMRRQFKFTMKEWHNIVLMTLIQNPVIILCTNKPKREVYKAEQYLPYDKWDDCLELYRLFLSSHHIPYFSYDYTLIPPVNFDKVVAQARKQSEDMLWWRALWLKGWGCAGSVHPKVLLVAERIGPNNTHNIPFETGPTGYMLTDLLSKTGTPFGKFTVTNLVKSFRRDDRPPNETDMAMLQVELENLKPEKVVFMGTTAKKGAKIAKSLGIEHAEYTHFGYYSHQGSTSIQPYINSWRQLFNIVPPQPL